MSDSRELTRNINGVRTVATFFVLAGDFAARGGLAAVGAGVRCARTTVGRPVLLTFARIPPPRAWWSFRPEASPPGVTAVTWPCAGQESKSGGAGRASGGENGGGPASTTDTGIDGERVQLGGVLGGRRIRARAAVGEGQAGRAVLPTVGHRRQGNGGER